MNEHVINFFTFGLGITLAITGFLATFILNRIATDLKTALTKIEMNSQDIAIIKVQIEQKMSKLDCMKCKV
jgi:5-bromo-4-chloroindolyl phosphate hydrolysis protein